MPRLDNILVYHWQAWKGFLISHLVADYCSIEAKYDDDIKRIERYLTPNIKAVLMQVNLSHSNAFPARRRELIQALKERHILVLNSEIENISKRHLHQLLDTAGLPSARANRTGAADQLLFIKSNLNWGGITEQRLPCELQPLINQKPALIQSWDSYYSIKRSDVEPEHWEDSSIVIETFIENPENSFFRVYGFGDSIVIVKAHSEALIKKICGHPGDENYSFNKRQILEQKTALPTGLQKAINSFIIHYPLTYFCLDIVHDMQTYYIIDLNLTPYAGVEQQTMEAVNFLCQGAHSYLKTRLQKELLQA